MLPLPEVCGREWVAPGLLLQYEGEGDGAGSSKTIDFVYDPEVRSMAFLLAVAAFHDRGSRFQHCLGRWRGPVQL